eukprot:6119870-Pyramimonas_sp.AAC.1
MSSSVPSLPIGLNLRPLPLPVVCLRPVPLPLPPKNKSSKSCSVNRARNVAMPLLCNLPVRLPPLPRHFPRWRRDASRGSPEPPDWCLHMSPPPSSGVMIA